MWLIIKTEFEYNKKLFGAVLAFVPLLCFYEFMIAGERKGYVLILIYLATVFWSIFRNREKRELQLARLPISPQQLALVRIVVVLLTSFAVMVGYLLVYWLFHTRSPENAIRLLAYPAIMLLGFTFYFVFYDLRRLGDQPHVLSAKAFKSIAIFAFFLINALLFYGIYQTKTTGRLHWIIAKIDYINLLTDPPANATHIFAFFGLSLLLADSTLFTYSKRKSYLR